MARGKKKESALTPEEKLAQAQVPAEEQPYRVPENWCWVHLDAVLTEIKNGTTIKQDKSGEGYSVTRIESLQNQTIDFGRLGNIVDASAIKETDWYKEGDIALSHINSAEHVGKTALITSDMLPLVHGMNLLRLRFNEACLPVFYQYYSQSFQYKSEILDRINMAVNQVSINQKQLGSMEFPLPPIKEQQRIVDRIEYLFAKLDEAKEKAQSVVDSFETRKAAILHKAFTGELTAKWRVENGIKQDSRITTNVGDIVKLLSGQDFKPEAYNSNGNGIPYITGASNFDNDHVIINRWTPEPTVIAQRADILLVCKGSGFGKVIIADFESAHIARQIMALRVKVGTDTRFIYYFLQSEYEYLRSNGQGLIPGISRSVVINLPIMLPAFSEQQEIVRILDSLFAKEQQAKEAAEVVLEKIDLLKKSILARAFRGELGTNDPTEESALELLMEVIRGN